MSRRQALLYIQYYLRFQEQEGTYYALSTAASLLITATRLNLDLMTIISEEICRYVTYKWVLEKLASALWGLSCHNEI